MPAHPRPITRWPVFGHLPGFVRDPLGTLRRAGAHGDMTRLDLGFGRVLLLHRPEHADHVLREHRRNYGKQGPFWDGVRGLLGGGLPSAEGELWLVHRRLMQPQFLRRRIALLAPLVVAAIDRSIRWPDVGTQWTTLDLGARMPHIAMNVASAAMFGLRTSRDSATQMQRDFDFALAYMFRAMLGSALPPSIPIPGVRRFRRAVDSIRATIERTIEARRRGATEGDDLLSGLLAATDAQTGTTLTHEALRDELVSLFVAGYETTASGLSWSLHNLVEHPQQLARLRDAVDEALDGDRPTHADLPALDPARRVMAEALRLCPPAWWLPRCAAAHDQIGSTPIEAGALVAPCVYTIHRHPDHWPDPERFDPDRHTAAQQQQRHPLAWLPFGAGPRRCIGEALAMMEATFTLAMLVQRYEFGSVGHRTTPKLGTVIAPRGGVAVRIRRRRETAAHLGRPSTRRSSSEMFVL